MSPETQRIFEMVKIIIEETNFSFDQTKRGRVVEKLNNNIYKVRILEDVYTIKSKFDFNVNESVLVLFPCGSRTDLYIYPNK